MSVGGICSRVVATASAKESVITARGVRTVDESVPIEQALRTTAGAGVRRLVVTGEEGKPVGPFSIDAVLELLAEKAEAVGRLLRRERPRIGSRG